MMSIQKQHNGLKIQTIILVVVGLFCLGCILLSALMPRLTFEVGVQPTSTGNGLIVKRIYVPTKEIQHGDFIEAVAGKPVHTKAELYYHLLLESGSVDITLRRVGAKFERLVSASEFSGDSLPVGILASDRVISITTEEGSVNMPESTDLAALKEMLDSRGGSVKVVFKHQEEIVSTSTELRSSAARTIGASFALILFALMAALFWKSTRAKNRKYCWANLTLGLGTVGILTLGLWGPLQSMPFLYMLGIIGLTMFKVVDFDYHLVHLGSKRRIEPWMRIAIYVGPAITVLIPVWLCITEFPMMWGGAVEGSFELKTEAFAYLPLVWCVLFTLIDGAVLLLARHKDPWGQLHAQEIGVLLACVLSVFVFILLRTDMQGAQWFLMAMILVQTLSDALPLLIEKDQLQPLKLTSQEFSLTPVRKALERAHALIGDSWLIQIVIERPSPKHIVAMVRSDDEFSLTGLDLNVLSEPWRDFLEVLRVENGCITGENVERNPQDPVQGIADRLGIVVALPIADNVAGTLTSLKLLVSTLGEPKPDEVPSFSLSSNQRDQLLDIIDSIIECAPAIVYQSAEMSLDYVGDDLDEVVRQCRESASVAQAIRNQTSSLNERELPHGLLDEDDEDGEGARSNLGFAASRSHSTDSCETKEYAEEVSLLRSQVNALNSQQIRECALSEIEFTETQRAAFKDIESLDPPILFVGEPGTGKHLLAVAAHQDRSEGAFLSIDAASCPESIFELDMFGDGDNPGMIQGAAGGGLFIRNVDRLSDDLLDEILDHIEQLPPSQSIALYLSVDVTPDAFSVSQYRLEPMRLPKELRDLAARCDAEVVVLDPLRNQQDLDVAANFFRQKQAIRCDKTVEGFSPEALLALKSYAWPGNFNEMRLVIERAVLKAEGNTITLADLGRDFEELSDASTKNLAFSGTDVFREQVQLLQALNETQQDQINRLNARILQLLDERGQVKPHDDTDDAFFDGTYADIERRLLDKLLDKYQRDPEKAAEALALNRARFFNKLSKYQLIQRDI